MNEIDTFEIELVNYLTRYGFELDYISRAVKRCSIDNDYKKFQIECMKSAKKIREAMKIGGA